MRRGGSGGPMAARGGALPGPPARPSGEQPTCGHRAQPRPRCSPSPGRPWLLCGFVARGLHRVRGAHRGRLPRTGALLLAAARWVALGCPAFGTRGHGRVSLPRRVTGGPRCFSPPLPPLPPSPWSVTAAMPRAVCSARDFPSVRLEPRRRLPIPRSVTGTPLVALKPAGTAGIPAVPTHYERGCGGRHRAQLAEPPRPSSVPPRFPPRRASFPAAATCPGPSPPPLFPPPPPSPLGLPVPVPTRSGTAGLCFSSLCSPTAGRTRECSVPAPSPREGERLPVGLQAQNGARQRGSGSPCYGTANLGICAPVRLPHNPLFLWLQHKLAPNASSGNRQSGRQWGI